MRVFALILFYISRVLAILAILAGLAAGFLQGTLGVAFTCFDSCPPPYEYFARFAPATQALLTPCLVIEALALVTFVGYCAATGQVRRAIKQTAILLVGGLVGVAALVALFQLCQATLPVTVYYQVDERPAEMWVQWWGIAIFVLAGGWSGMLALLQWNRTAQGRPARPL